MTQDERWHKRYQDVMDFLEQNHRNPSRHHIEEHVHLNWLKANRKLLNAGQPAPEYKQNEFMVYATIRDS